MLVEIIIYRSQVMKITEGVYIIFLAACIF